MKPDDNEAKPLRSVALQNAQAVLLARERAERELRDSNERITNILESITDAFVGLDHEWRFTYVNPQAEDILRPLNKSRSTILGNNYGQEFPDLVGSLVEAGFRRAVAEKVKIKLELFCAPLHAWFQIRACPAKDGLSVYFLDITEQRQASDEQRRLLRSLSEARDHLEKPVQERTAELAIANENLRDLSVRLMKVQDEERRRLARDLHDGVGQIPAAISMNLGVVQAQSENLDARGARAVSENVHLVERVSTEIRTISHLLHPPLLEIAGLASALR
ncbi:MAG: histidine kinase, partial [Candidatus Sulfotelmatobacter sp.]